jgi:signal transduction histidine kinase
MGESRSDIKSSVALSRHSRQPFDSAHAGRRDGRYRSKVGSAVDERDIGRSGPGPTGAQTLRVLEGVLAAVREASGYPDVLFRICRAVTRTVPCDRATVYVWSRRRQAFLPVADHGTPPEMVQDFVERGFAPGSFPFEEDLRQGRVVSAVRGDGSGPLDPLLSLARLHALAVLPLAFQGLADGTLSCGLHGPPAFSSEQLAGLESLAPHIAVVIQNSRLEARAGRLAERRARLAAWAAEVLGSRDLDEMSARLCEASRTLFGASRARLLLLRDGVLVGNNVAGAPAERPFTLPLDAEAPVTDALRLRQVLVLNQFRETRYARTLRIPGTPPASVLAVPLVDGAGPVGVLAVADLEHPFRFGTTDEEDARLLATIATVALRKGLLVEALTRANAAKSEFLASVSHDLRTPLNVIVGYTQLVAEGTFGPVGVEQADALGRVLRTAAGQLALINDLLDLARIEQGKLTCHPRAIAVAELEPSLRDTMEALLRDRSVRFETEIAADAIARTDPERLRQVLGNLLSNAAKFTQAGHVRLAAVCRDGRVAITVSDTGSGMDADLRARAFEPFVRGDGEAAGSGLGLSIVARLLPLLGGQLRIASEPGVGTTIELIFPAA